MSSQNINPESLPSSTKSNQDEGNASKGQSVAKRLQKELMALMMSTEKSVSAFPENENFFRWIGTITGPKETVYDGQRYRLLLEFPNSYPYSPPSVHFLTKCFHPNIDLQGALCLDILKEKWSALYDVRTILLSIQSLLGEPNNESPLNSQAASMWVDQVAYKKHLDNFYEKNKSEE